MAQDNIHGSLESLIGKTTAHQPLGKRGPAPVHLWNPPDCGPIDMRIARDGTWYYMNSPIGRLPLVQLFASVLRRDGDDYCLVTPVEKVGIRVDDAPFLAIRMAQDGDALRFTTNVEDEIIAGPDHPLRFELEPGGGLKPYLHVRANLWALVKRALFYDLVALGETRLLEGVAMFGVCSQGAFFPMAPAATLEGL